MKKLLLICIWVFSMASYVHGQTSTITGTVTEKEQGGPLPGTSIVVKGSRTGALSNAQGKFSINATIGQTLVFSTVGFKTQSIVLSGKIVNVVMEPTQSELSEVMVVAYGTQLRRDNVSASSQIKGSEITEQPVQNFEQSLAGKAAGVQITIPNSVLNTPPVFHIRGTGSINLSSQPIIVVDGIVSLTGDFSGGESGGNALSNINPDDIEDIQILKDASATAIYGSRGANGVVLVTTKKGKKGDAVFTLDGWLGETSVNRLPKVLDANQYVAIKTESIANGGGNPANTAVVINNDANGNPINTNWEQLLYQKGVSYNTSFSVSGGNDKTTYYGSVNWSKQTGVLRSYEYDNKSALFNIEHKISKAITFGAKVSYQNNQNLASIGSGSLAGEAYATTGLGRQAVLLPPNLSPYNNDGTYNLNPSTGALGIMNDRGISISYTNPIVSIDLDRYNNEINHVAASTYLQIKPLPWITLKTVYGIDYLFTNNDSFSDPVQNFSVTAGVVTNTASATDSYLSTKHYTWDNTAQFDKSFGKHAFSLLLGNEQEGNLQSGFGLNRSILSDPAFNVIQAGYQNVVQTALALNTTYLVSFFGRFNYNFDEKYFLTASLRRDGASQFGSDKKYGLFPSIGGGWEITKENFWKKIGADKLFSSFKLRGSYGVVSNNSGLGAYASYGLYSATGLYNGSGTIVPSQTGNNSLSWETTRKGDGGIDFGMLNDRITASIDAYYDNTTGLILNYPEAPSAGLPTSPPVNIGTMFNRGLEFNINADIIKTRSFHWTANFNISFNQNKITSLIPGTNSITYSTSSLETANINRVGGSIGDLYIIRSAGVDPANGDRVFLNAQGQKVDYTFTGTQHWYNQDGTPYVAKLGTGINQTADASDYGNTAPKEYGGLSNTFHYKNFDLNILMTYQLGFYVYYGTQATLTDQRFWNNSTIILDHWTTPGQIASYPKVVFGDNVSNGTSFPTDFNTYRGDFLKLKTVNLGYTLPKSLLTKVGVKSMRVYISGQNLLIFTKYPGPDPEVSSNGTSINGNSAQGVDRNTAGNGRTLIAGFSLKF